MNLEKAILAGVFTIVATSAAASPSAKANAYPISVWL
jgi:hypothetical protein